MSRSRFQAIPIQNAEPNPNLTPRPPKLAPWVRRGRFQNVNLPIKAEERTRVNEPTLLTQKQETQTTDASGNSETTKEETVTTVIDE
jgi:hypothetical protein